MPDTLVDLPDGRVLHVPAGATPEQLSQLRSKLASQYKMAPEKKTAPPADTHKFLADNAKHQFNDIQSFLQGGRKESAFDKEQRLRGGPSPLESQDVFTSGPRKISTGEAGTVETRPSSLFTPKIASHIGRGLQADKFGAVLSSLLDPLIQAGSNVATGQRVTPQQAANVALMLAAPPQAKEAGSAVEGGLGFLRKKAMQVGEKSPLLGKALDVAPSIYQKVAKPVGRMAEQEERIVARTSGRYAKGASRATQEGQVKEGGVQEHQRVPQGRNVPENKGKVRQAEGGRPGDSGRNVSEAQKPAKEAVAPTSPKKGDILTTKKGIEFRYVGPEMKSQGRGRPRLATGEHVIQGVATGSKQTISAEEFAKLNPKTPEHTIQGFG